MNKPPRALLPLSGTLLAFDAAATRRLEACAAAPCPQPSLLMERAGLSAARLARALCPGAGQVSVLCGPGNNGGDGWVAAWHLHRWGVPVTAHAIGGESRSADHRGAMARARAAGVPISSEPQPSTQAELVLDALLGIGLRSAPAGELAHCLRALAQHPARKLALDLPSGLEADTGRDWGAAACTDTLTFLGAKPGLFTGAGRALAGRVWLDELGASFEAESAVAELVGSELVAGWRALSPRAQSSHGTHKGRQGDLWVLGGAMPGAAMLAARAGLHAGAGRVYLDGRLEADSIQPELILRALPAEGPPIGSCLVAGCGWGEGQADRLAALLDCHQHLVLDADALNSLAADAGLRTQLQQRAGRGARTILTPHPLEAARLLQTTVAEVQADRLHWAQALAQGLNCTVLLKGSGTVAASPGQRPLINTTGHGALASAGTGDVLAGWLGGLWAQAPSADPQRLAALAAAWHGLAADQLPQGSAPLPASQLVQRMHQLHP
ncbi:NAD(P)H-hydrate dehydratase [Inhella sp.]|uniref:NAD(P)H-hydrate dehydratase n=1 Tax=Inhella sp. TaxID=1921806 RepID=UPI0035B344F0